MKEALAENLALEKRALKVVESLLEDSVAEDFLVDCVCFMTRDFCCRLTETISESSNRNEGYV